MGANLVPPHGGRLLPLLVARKERQEGLKEAKLVPRVTLSSKEASDLNYAGDGGVCDYNL